MIIVPQFERTFCNADVGLRLVVLPFDHGLVNDSLCWHFPSSGQDSVFRQLQVAVVGQGAWEFALLFNKRLLCAVMMLEMFGIEL